MIICLRIFQNTHVKSEHRCETRNATAHKRILVPNKRQHQNYILDIFFLSFSQNEMKRKQHDIFISHSQPAAVLFWFLSQTTCSSMYVCVVFVIVLLVRACMSLWLSLVLCTITIHTIECTVEPPLFVVHCDTIRGAPDATIFNTHIRLMFAFIFHGVVRFVSLSVHWFCVIHTLRMHESD